MFPFWILLQNNSSILGYKPDNKELKRKQYLKLSASFKDAKDPKEFVINQCKALSQVLNTKFNARFCIDGHRAMLLLDGVDEIEGMTTDFFLKYFYYTFDFKKLKKVMGKNSLILSIVKKGDKLYDYYYNLSKEITFS